MSDLIERLRRWNIAENATRTTSSIMRDLGDAADEIERLRVVAIALIDSEYCADGYRNISVGEDEFAALKDAVRSRRE
jgi:hypothetical protein